MDENAAGYRARLESIFNGEDIFVDPSLLVSEQEAVKSDTQNISGIPSGKEVNSSNTRQGMSSRSSSRSRSRKQTGTASGSDSSDGPTLRKAQMARQKNQQPKSGYRHVIRSRKPNATTDLDVDDVASAEVRQAQDISLTGLGEDQLAPREESFTPWTLVEKYPSNFIGNRNRPAASPYFEPPAVYNNQIWDFYYIQHPEPGKLPVLLVPTKQLQHLFKHTNAALGIHLTIPVGVNADKFKVLFGLGGTPRPRYLGRTASLEEFLALPDLKSLPDGGPFNGVTSQAEQQFRELMRELSKLQTFRKGDAKKKKRAIQRVTERHEWGLTTKRVQRYLGLRQGKLLSASEGMSADTQEAARGLESLTLGASKGKYQPTKFVCVDVETYELNHNIVTEIGIASIDIPSLRGIPAGEKSLNWFSLIKSHHYVIKENAWAMNGQHVANNQKNFNFGTSLLVPKSSIFQEVASHLGLPTSSRSGHSDARVVLVGHDIIADVEHLMKISYDARKVPNIVDVVDTTHMFQHWRRERNATRLSRVLDSLEISYRYLHNAGNDATYTLQAMLALAQVTCEESFSRAMGKKIERPLQGNEQDTQEGWSSDEGNDGGDPVGLPRANG